MEFFSASLLCLRMRRQRLILIFVVKRREECIVGSSSVITVVHALCLYIFVCDALLYTLAYSTPKVDFIVKQIIIEPGWSIRA